MIPTTYLRVLALPGVLRTLGVMFVVGLPVPMAALSMTLHVLNDLGLDYTQAGWAGAAVTAGAAIGSPWIGRLLDRYGLRPVALVCGIVSTALWCVMPFVSYGVLLSLAVPAMVFGLPTSPLARQFLASLVPAEQRRAVFSLNVILMEVSFIIGPTLCVLFIAWASPRSALLAIGLWRGANCLAMYLVDWPLRSATEKHSATTQQRLALRDWLSRRLAGSFLIAFGALFVLCGSELALIAALREHGQVQRVGLAMGLMAMASIAGGLVHGTLQKSWSQATLALLLAALVIPVAWLQQPVWLLMLALMPSNLFCTPTLAANAETVTQLAPAAARGEALGLQDAAARLGQALAGPIVGLAIDRGSPSWGFVATGVGGLLMACAGWSLQRRTSTAVPLRPAALGGRPRS